MSDSGSFTAGGGPDGAGAARPAVAMVLAAGLGQRMRPLTDNRPKPLVEVAGRPLIDHVLARIAEAGISRAVVNVHYRADMLERHLGRARAGVSIEISDERARLLDTGGGLVKAMPLLWRPGEERLPVLIHNSDSIWLEGVGRALDRLIRAFDPARMDALLLVAPTTAATGYDGPGDFQMDAAGVISRRRERQIVPFVFAGVSLAARGLLDGAPDGPFSLNLLWDRAMASGRLYGVRLDGLWMHVGDPSAVAEAELRIANRG